MEVELFVRFVVVLYLFTEARLCYASSFPGSIEEVEVSKHLNRLNKPPVKSIKSPDGDIIDCVRISHQVAFDHPLLKNHTIKMRPNVHPNWIKDENININMNASKVGQFTSSPKETIAQLWHSNGKCPKGTIPIIRTTKEDLLRADSLKNYGKKKIFPDAQPGFDDPRNHEYAHAQTGGGIFHGAKATFNLWNPRVQEQNYEFSLSQLWVTGGSYPDLDTIEAGWHVNPLLNGDTNTRLFIFWTNEGYKTGCYNLKCSGFIQTNSEIAIGDTISPTSQVDGSQYEITILIWKDTRGGDWWMQVNDKVVGYWPSTLFSYLSKSASGLDFGGEVVNLHISGQHTSTQMGSGHFPQEGYGKASYIRNIQAVDESNALRTLQDLNGISDPSKSCYDIVKGVNDNTWGSHFFFGGPGRNQNCP